MNANLYSLFESHFPSGTEQPCILHPGGPVVHYDDLARLSAQIAHALCRAGCRPGDRVAVQTEKHWHVLALYLACLRAGLVYLPLNTGYQKGELSYFFGNAEPRVVVCGNDNLGTVAISAGPATVLTLDAYGGELIDRAIEEPQAFETAPRAPDDLAAIVYTSGTTGRSKGAMLSHRNLASNALALVEAWGYTESDILLHALPIYHVHGLFVATHCTLLSGARMLWLPKFDAREVSTLLPHASVLMGVPTYYARLLHEPTFNRDRCRGVRLFISGSAPLLPETFQAFRARTGHAILERYGMTETGMITTNPLDGARVAGTVGRPLPGVSVRVVDKEGGLCDPGDIGGVQVKGPNVFAGYWRMPDKTAEDFTRDGFFKTGDVGEWVASGEGRGYLRLVGRAKDMIITGGLNVYPCEIEERINEIEGVVESAVIGVPHEDYGEAVTAVVVLEPGHDVIEQHILSSLRREIASFKIPKRVFFVHELPRNAMGKVQKNILRERYTATAN
ncbi:MAG TPA: malonyl-CoA synthase [Casimicrobiaceae bacterium]|nr:malonyl-CoA synthase [Casimicrobiaceae bacterium]